MIAVVTNGKLNAFADQICSIFIGSGVTTVLHLAIYMYMICFAELDKYMFKSLYMLDVKVAM